MPTGTATSRPVFVIRGCASPSVESPGVKRNRLATTSTKRVRENSACTLQSASRQEATVIPDVQAVIVTLLSFAIGITVHEFSHTAAALLLGDKTATRAGRLTLNPLKHLDPFGTLLLLLASVSGGPGFGWGKPVPVNGYALAGGRRGMALVSAAGPASNLLMAIICALGAQHLPDIPGTAGEIATKVIETSFFLNIGLAAFNLLPLPPLDGFAVATGLLPARMANQLGRIEQFGPGILLLLVFAPSIIRIDILGLIIGPIRRVLIIAALWITGIG